MRRMPWLVLAAIVLGCGGSGTALPDPGGSTDLPGVDTGETVTDLLEPSEDVLPGTDPSADPMPDGPEEDAPPMDLPDGQLPDPTPDPATDPAPPTDTPPTDLPPIDLVPGDLPADGSEDVSYLYQDCRGLLQCFQDCCGGQDPCPAECADLCWNAAAPEARNDWNAYLACIQQQCPSCGQNPRPPECDSCERTAQAGDCRDPALRCYDFGEWTCAQVVSCIGGCPDLTACITCVERASPEAHLWLDPLGQCLVTACPSGNPDSPTMPLTPCEVEALSGTCETAYNDCLAH